MLLKFTTLCGCTKEEKPAYPMDDEDTMIPGAIGLPLGMDVESAMKDGVPVNRQTRRFDHVGSDDTHHHFKEARPDT